MKIFKINLLILLFVFIQFHGYSQSEKNMTNNTTIIHLKNGKNPSIKFEELIIEPINLFIQSKPLNKDAPHIQLELNVIKNNTKHTSFLWCYDPYTDNPKTNYPKAYQNYSFYLKTKEAGVELVIEKLDFGKTMFLDLSETAVIGNLEVLYKGHNREYSVDIDGNQENAFNTYTISLSEKNEKNTPTVMSLNKTAGKELEIEWKDYKIFILDDSEKAINLLVLKTDSKK